MKPVLSAMDAEGNSVPSSHMGSVGYGSPKLSKRSAEVVGLAMDTVHLLPKKGELRTSSVPGATGYFVRLKYPSNSESCWDRKKPASNEYQVLQVLLLQLPCEERKNQNRSHGRKLLYSSKTRYQQGS